ELDRAVIAGRARSNRPLASLVDEARQTSGRRVRMPHDLGPREATAEPSRCSDDGGLSTRIVHWLALVLLTIELKEEAQARPREIHVGDELFVLVVDARLAYRGSQVFDTSR